MSTKNLPELLKSALQGHIEQDDLQDNEENRALIRKLSALSDKVAEAKARALARRASVSNR